jgi:hypothetical protein
MLSPLSSVIHIHLRIDPWSWNMSGTAFLHKLSHFSFVDAGHTQYSIPSHLTVLPSVYSVITNWTQFGLSCESIFLLVCFHTLYRVSPCCSLHVVYSLACRLRPPLYMPGTLSNLLVWSGNFMYCNDCRRECSISLAIIDHVWSHSLSAAMWNVTSYSVTSHAQCRCFWLKVFSLAHDWIRSMEIWALKQCDRTTFSHMPSLTCNSLSATLLPRIVRLLKSCTLWTDI